ncbi:MAG: FAD-dependent oxidoreductase [Clostridia bacterium]|nr:FAD-dependent oxidoreductase [Clostridia bacterium]
MKRYDVVVVGGGFAGIGSALASARSGAKTLIVDKSNCFGGASVNSLVNPFMPFCTKIGEEYLLLSQGIFLEIHKKLKERGSIKGMGFLEEDLKFLINDMMIDADVDIMFNSYLSSVENVNGKIKSVTFATKGGQVTVEGDYFIDATGDAMLASLAGVPTVLGREGDNLCQPMTLCFRVGNVDVERFMKGRDNLSKAYTKAFNEGKFINPREDILVFKTPIPNVLNFNTTRVVKFSPIDAVEVTQAEIIARKQVKEIFDFMKEHACGFENAFLMMTAHEIGVRESRQIVGDYVLTEKDCRNFTIFEDAITACNYDIDIHNPEGSGTSHYYFPEGKFYTIPYRSLIPKTVENMLVAGRCISSDHGAQASYRVMSTVCNIGEAAGTAIGLAVKNKSSVREIDVKKLQTVLKSNGAFIGL